MPIRQDRFFTEEYVYPRTINWVTIIEDIKDSGISYSSISRIMGVSWSTLQWWRTGTELKHSAGSGLLLVHTKHCGAELTKQRILEAEITDFG